MQNFLFDETNNYSSSYTVSVKENKFQYLVNELIISDYLLLYIFGKNVSVRHIYFWLSILLCKFFMYAKEKN